MDYTCTCMHLLLELTSNHYSLEMVSINQSYNKKIMLILIHVNPLIALAEEMKSLGLFIQFVFLLIPNPPCCFILHYLPNELKFFHSLS